MKNFIRQRIERKQRQAILIQAKKIRQFLWRVVDIFSLPLVLLSGLALKKMRKGRFVSFPASKKLLFAIGVYPINDHYYDPMFNPRHLRYSPRRHRDLPAINFNVQEQLRILSQFHFNDELLMFPMEREGEKIEFAYNYGQFKAGDAEYLYSMIRHFKPRCIIEIGGGQSTLMMLNGIQANTKEDPAYSCDLMCVEPYENAWLETLNIKVIRQIVERIDLTFFQTLQAGDILFIDSSHIIKPQGDVLFEYLEILPCLKPGVIVHVHDIFMPRDYPDEWISNAYFWNEQYLLEAFLSYNNKFRIIGALNYLTHNHFDEVSTCCPVLKMEFEQGLKREPGSIWLIKDEK